MAPPILFAVESAVSRAPQLSSQRAVNCFVERQNPDAKSQSPIFGAPGLDLFSTAGAGPNRGSWNFNGSGYFVQGQSLYLVTAAGVATQVGTGILGTGPVSMSDNGNQICIVNGAEGYIYTLAFGLQQITDPAFYPANTVNYMDGYFKFERLGTNEWFLSNLFDGTTFNGLDFASAEAEPGFVTATAQNLQLNFIFCTGHIELWYDTGAFPFPFQIYPGGVIYYGCISPQTIIQQDGALFFLGVDHVFYRLQANTPIRVSTHPIETLIANAPEITSAYCFTYSIEGHKFVVLQLVSANLTLVYDISTGKWHERESWQQMGGTVSSLGYWRATSALQIFDTVIFGDSQGGSIGKIDWTTYTEYGNPLRMLARSVEQHHDRGRLFIGRFELDVEAGVGLTAGQGSDPQIMLRKSTDGGRTWSLPQLWRSMGMIGAYRTRCRWMKQGSARQIMWEVSIVDPVFRCIIAAHADIEMGM
jgi:hypothetical protein